MSKGPPSFSFRLPQEKNIYHSPQNGVLRGAANEEGRERLSDLHRSPLISTDEMVNHYTEVK